MPGTAGRVSYPRSSSTILLARTSMGVNLSCCCLGCAEGTKSGRGGLHAKLIIPFIHWDVMVLRKELDTLIMLPTNRGEPSIENLFPVQWIYSSYLFTQTNQVHTQRTSNFTIVKGFIESLPFRALTASFVGPMSGSASCMAHEVACVAMNKKGVLKPHCLRDSMHKVAPPLPPRPTYPPHAHTAPTHPLHPAPTSPPYLRLASLHASQPPDPP